ncbi:MAG: hypothetical protein CL820_02730 [Croceicoccus sp.]|nr:hypothetical protein [Croceicoccus sp.]
MDCRPPAAQRTRRVIAAGKGSPDSGSKPQQVHQRRRHARGVQGAANRCGHGVLMVWHRNRPDKARHYGAAFKRICKRLLAGNPMCAICEERPAKIADHRTPICLGGETTEANLQAICPSCLMSKTGKEGAAMRAAKCRARQRQEPRT